MYQYDVVHVCNAFAAYDYLMQAPDDYIQSSLVSDQVLKEAALQIGIIADGVSRALRGQNMRLLKTSEAEIIAVIMPFINIERLLKSINFADEPYTLDHERIASALVKMRPEGIATNNAIS